MEQQRKKKRRKKKYMKNTRLLLIIGLVFIVVIAVVLWLIKPGAGGSGDWKVARDSDNPYDDGRPDIDVALLTPNAYSRPQEALEHVKGIVIHYTANPGSGAMANRNYFEGLKDSHETHASSHFVVGIEGEIVQCIPTSEISYASNSRNSDTISIEVCHPDETGKFTDITYKNLVWLTGWLCTYLDIDPDEIIRHYDVTGKICPKYFVDHEDKWEVFKSDVKAWIKDNS